jgi:hypothetical protein
MNAAANGCADTLRLLIDAGAKMELRGTVRALC